MGDEHLARLVSLAGRALSARIVAELEEHGIGRGEYRVLFALCEREGVSQTDLCERHRLDKGALARVVARLEERGYVERRPDPDDGRRKLLYLTDAGEALRPEIEDLKARIDRELTAGFSEAEREAFAESLERACRNLTQGER